MEEVTTTEQVAEEVQEETPAVVEEVAQEETQSEEIEIPKPKKPNYQERINELTRKRREAEREAEHWKELVSKKEVIQTSNRPQLENFSTQEAYEDALFDWRDKGKQSEIQKTQQIKSEEEALVKFKANAEKVKSVYEDFDEIVEQPVFSPTMREVLLNSDEGPMVSYFLGRPENQETADKIRRLPERQQVYELGKLEAKLILAQKQKKPTGAPTPISPVGATGGGTIDESKLSDDEWFKLEQQRELAKLKKKYGG